MLRLAAMFGRASAVLSFVLGRGGSTSRTIRSISRIAPRWNCLASIGGEPVEQLVEHHPEGIDVGARVDVHRRRVGLLGRHVRRRAHDRPDVGEAHVGQLHLGRLGHAEVDHLRRRPAVHLRDQHVARLQVAVDDPLLVGVLHRLADRDEQLQPGLHRQPLLVAILGERHALAPAP